MSCVAVAVVTAQDCSDSTSDMSGEDAFPTQTELSVAVVLKPVPVTVIMIEVSTTPSVGEMAETVGVLLLKYPN